MLAISNLYVLISAIADKMAIIRASIYPDFFGGKVGVDVGENFYFLYVGLVQLGAVFKRP